MRNIIKRPRITEKATAIRELGGYVFEVSPRATKNEVKKAIQSIYNVAPIRVNMITMPGKTVLVRGRVGKKSRGKKAIVFLKKGDKIEDI